MHIDANVAQCIPHQIPVLAQFVYSLFSCLRIPTKLASLGISIFLLFSDFVANTEIDRLDDPLKINNRLSINDNRSPIDC